MRLGRDAPGVFARDLALEYNEAQSRWSLAAREGEGWDFGSGGPGEIVLSNAAFDRSLRIARVCASASAILGT